MGWCLRHPVGVIILTLAVMVLGLLALTRLNIDLLPRIIYPEIRVRVTHNNVAATIMEEEVTRPLEAQLATTEDAIAIQSQTSTGTTAIDLAFRYGTDIDQALRDATIKVARAQRDLPSAIDAPSIIKRDPFQLPVTELIMSSTQRDSLNLRTWVQEYLSPQLLLLPGVAAIEIGGGLEREIHVTADQWQLAALGCDVTTLATTIAQANIEIAVGRWRFTASERPTRITGRLLNATDILALPLVLPHTNESAPTTVYVRDIAQVVDTTAEERMRIRLNAQPGIKVSIQKQPQANTVAVVEQVDRALTRLTTQGIIPTDVQVTTVEDQALPIRYALRNATNAAVSGALLAMLVVYVFLGNVRRTLIIGMAIPIATVVTFSLMAALGLTLNLMTLGGLALGTGMLVDNTIIILDNLYRYQQRDNFVFATAEHAVREVVSAIVASTTTNLAAVLPFLFIGGLIGLLFRELIITISAAIIASLIVALTVVPTLAVRISPHSPNRWQTAVERLLSYMGHYYAVLLRWALRWRWVVISLFVIAGGVTIPDLLQRQQVFLPEFDDGRVRIQLTGDDGIRLESMDDLTRQVEQLIAAQPDVMTVFTTVGGVVSGRTSIENPNRATIQVQLHPSPIRQTTTRQWSEQLRRSISAAQFIGLKVTMTSGGLRGIRLGRGTEEVNLRLTGPDLQQLESLAEQMTTRLKSLTQLRDVQQSNALHTVEFVIQPRRLLAAQAGIDLTTLGSMLQFALDGQVVTELLAAEQRIGVRVRLQTEHRVTPEQLSALLLFSPTTRRPIRLGDIAHMTLQAQPVTILHDQQSRMLEITATLAPTATLTTAIPAAHAAIADIALPTGYVLYEAGALDALQQERTSGLQLIALALFLVFVAMAVQYESLRNPLIILLSVPFALIGVTLGLEWAALPLSLPVWLGIILLVGLVVNNAIILVEFIEQRRHAGDTVHTAILMAAQRRLRPILMTTLTTVLGMLPLAMTTAAGTELLRPLAVTLVAGLVFSLGVSLLLVPAMYDSVTATAS